MSALLRLENHFNFNNIIRLEKRIRKICSIVILSYLIVVFIEKYKINHHHRHVPLMYEHACDLSR